MGLDRSVNYDHYSDVKILDVPRSGSYAGITSSRNRNGQYVRTRAVPVNPGTSFQQTVRARMSTRAGVWRSLTSTQRTGWADLGAQMIRTDSLGQTYDLTGLQAYMSVNNNLSMAGDAALSDAPLLVTPAALASMTPTITTTTFSVAFTVTPLGAGERLVFYAGAGNSSGITYEGDWRLISVSAAAATSPLDVFSAYVGRWGTPVVGVRIFCSGARYKGGFVGQPLLSSVVVAA